MSRTLQPLAGVRGVESLLLMTGPGECESWGVETPEEFAGWTHRVLGEFQALGEMLNAGRCAPSRRRDPCGGWCCWRRTGGN